jgi:hypothetical protein
MSNNLPVIEKSSNSLSLVFAEPTSALVLLKANLPNGSQDSLWVKCDSDSDIYSINFPNLLWKSAIISPSVFNVVLVKAKHKEGKLRTGEHHTPPKGYPTKRSQYAIPESYTFPIDSAKRVRSAMAYFTKHSFRNSDQKRRAASRIIRAAKKFGIEVSKDSNVWKTTHKTKKK